MKILKKYFALLICTLFILTPLSSCAGSKKTDVLKLSEVTHSVFYAPLYVAINNGMFEKNDIEIDLTTGEGADKVMTSILSGSADIGFAGPEASIYVYNEGREDHAQVFAQMTKRDGSFLISRDKPQNFQWSDLKGANILPGRKGGVPYMTLEYVLKQNGLEPGVDLILDDSIKYDLMAGAFISGTGDYFTCFEPVASTLVREGKGYIVASVGEESGEIPYTAFFASKSYIKKNADIIQRFVDSIYEGQKWVLDHSAKEIAEAVSPSFPDSDMELLETVIQNYMDIDAWNSNPVLTEDSFDRLQEVMQLAGELDKKVPYGDVVNNSFAEKSMK